MERIQGQRPGQVELAMQSLMWITCTKRQLTVSELRYALAIELDEEEFDRDNIPDLEDIISVCAGLVAIDDETQVTRLVHYTTQEYFKQTKTGWFPTADTDILNHCVTYLSYRVFGAGYYELRSIYYNLHLNDRLRGYPFYNYAACHWGHHARQGSATSPRVLRFLRQPAKVNTAAHAMLSEYSFSEPWLRGQVNATHLAAHFELEDLVESGIPDIHVNSRDGDGRTPLHWAAQRGHGSIVMSLLRAKANVNSVDFYGRTSLYVAVSQRHETVVKQLILAGADTNLGSAYDKAPLEAAVERGALVLVKMLLDAGADVNSTQIEFCSTPLRTAVHMEFTDIVKLLLDAGADTETTDMGGETPLGIAIDMNL